MNAEEGEKKKSTRVTEETERKVEEMKASQMFKSGKRRRRIGF